MKISIEGRTCQADEGNRKVGSTNPEILVGSDGEAACNKWEGETFLVKGKHRIQVLF